MILRAVLLRCVLCGSSGVFRWFRMKKQCPQCELTFEREQGQFVGAVGMNTIFSFGSILIAVIASFVILGPSANPVLLIGIIVGVAVAAPIFWFPVSKGLWGTFDLNAEPLSEDETLEGPWRRPEEKSQKD